MERTGPAAAPALLEMYQAMVLVRAAEEALVRLREPIAIIGTAGEDVSQYTLYRPGPP